VLNVKTLKIYEPNLPHITRTYTVVYGRQLLQVMHSRDNICFSFFKLWLCQWEIKPARRPHVHQQTQPYELHKTKYHRCYSTYV